MRIESYVNEEYNCYLPNVIVVVVIGGGGGSGGKILQGIDNQKPFQIIILRPLKYTPENTSTLTCIF
ncbi:hypothetical protein M0802_009913 [Mischocyttarus mexicanus]|nr:hypothetical protein M0802_009913 [Mischocyttarus mexicanus]